MMLLRRLLLQEMREAYARQRQELHALQEEQQREQLSRRLAEKQVRPSAGLAQGSMLPAYQPSG